MSRGLIARAAGLSFLQKIGVPMTAESRVMKGDLPKGPEQRRLV